MALHPVGSLSAATYWRRRALLALLLLAVVLFLKSWTGSGSGTTLSGKATAGHASPSPTVTTTASATPTSSPAAALASCANDVLTLVAVADAPSYKVGARPALSLVVRNTGAVACRRDVGSGAVELLVVSGSDRVWSSDDCASGHAANPVVLRPGASRAVRLSWSGKRSAPGCPGVRAQTVAGTYRVVARVGTLRREGATFTFQ